MGNDAASKSHSSRFWLNRKRQPAYQIRVSGLSIILLMMLPAVSPAQGSNLIGNSAQLNDTYSMQANETLVLKILIQSMMDLIDSSQMRAGMSTSTLDIDAVMLETEYWQNGLSPALSSQQILDGLADANESLALLNDPDAELDITPSMIPELIETISSIQEELSYAL